MSGLEPNVTSPQPAAPTPEQVARFLARCGYELTDWQRQILEQLAAGVPWPWPPRKPARAALANLLRQAATESVDPPGGRS